MMRNNVFQSTDLDPFRYHRLIKYCPYQDCTHFSFIRSLVILYSRVVIPTGYEPLLTRVRPYRIVLSVITSTIVDASNSPSKNQPLPAQIKRATLSFEMNFSATIYILRTSCYCFYARSPKKETFFHIGHNLLKKKHVQFNFVFPPFRI
jgi:hypothetical protein